MIDPQVALVFLGAYVSKVRKFDYKRLIPRARVEMYSYGALGFEVTRPWSKEGLGLGLGVGVIDLWLGWPRLEENLHTDDCTHPKSAAQIKELLQPVDD